MSINIYVLYTSVSLLQSHSVISLYHNWWNIPRNCSFVKDNSLSWQSGWYHLPLRGVEKINGLNILQIRILYGITMIDWYYKQLLLNIIVLIIICHKNIYKILDKRDMWSYQYQGIHVHVGSFVCVCSGPGWEPCDWSKVLEWQPGAWGYDRMFNPHLQAMPEGWGVDFVWEECLQVTDTNVPNPCGYH